MASVQTNIRIPEDVKSWLEAKAKEDGRTKGEVLARIIRPLMEGGDQFYSPSHLSMAGKANRVKSMEIRGMVDAMPVAGDSHKQQSLITKLDKTAGFDEFWSAYPKKKAKADALKAWTKNECWKIAGDIITDVNGRVRNDPSWADKQFVPNGATYLNGKRWEDEIIQQDNRPAFEKQGDALRDELFGNYGVTYDHE